MNIVMKREDLIAKLKARRAFAKKYDKEQLATHRDAEKEALKDFRDRLRTALKMPYEEVKKEFGGYRDGVDFNAPSCPVSFAQKLERCIKQLEMDQRQKLTIAPKDSTAEIHYCLTFDPGSEQRDMCA